MITYDKFRNSSLDLTILGLQDDPAVKGCQPPVQAKVLAWLTDAPVCFCQMPEHGEVVFTAAPNALPEERLIPVAENISNFIGLLISCQDAALIAGAYQWSSLRFRQLIGQVRPGMKAQSVIRALKNTYEPPVIDDPGAMMSRLRKDIPLIADPSAWSVGFGKDFLQPCPQELRAAETLLDRCITHEAGTWKVPSVYFCNEGIIVDVVLEVPVDCLLDFKRQWDGRPAETLALGDKLQRQLDDPLAVPATGILTVNDKALRCKQSFTASWNPLYDNASRVRAILNHYRLDPDRGYLFRRYCFLRKGKYPKIRSMELMLEATPVMVPEQTFRVAEGGVRFRFQHPCTGQEHCFTALELSHEALNPNFLTNHPCFYSRLTYALEPSISPENFRVVDCDPGDQWEGYQDEPAAVIYADRKPDPGRYVLSSLHYEPADHIQWQMIFRRKLHQDIHINLLP